MIKADVGDVLRHLDNNRNKRRMRALRLSKKCNEQLDSLYCDYFKMGKRKAFHAIVEEAVDLHYRLFMKSAEETQREEHERKNDK